MNEPHITYVTQRDGGDEIHLECRMSDGQKGAFIRVDNEFPLLASMLERLLNEGAQSGANETAAQQTVQMPETSESGNERPSQHFTAKDSQSAVAAAPPSVGTEDTSTLNTRWLIERNSMWGCEWFCAGEKVRWTKNAANAVHFPCSDSAIEAHARFRGVTDKVFEYPLVETGAGDWDYFYNITEHMFCATPSHTDIDCAQYLKDGETIAECIARNRKDVDGTLTLLVAEKKKSEALAREVAELTTANEQLYKHGKDLYQRVHDREANLAAERKESAKQKADIDRLHDALNNEVAAHERLKNAMEDAERYRFYVARLFSTTEDWPDAFANAQSANELSEAIDAARKVGP